jgi:hypothetical protein
MQLLHPAANELLKVSGALLHVSKNRNNKTFCGILHIWIFITIVAGCMKSTEKNTRLRTAFNPAEYRVFLHIQFYKTEVRFFPWHQNCFSLLSLYYQHQLWHYYCGNDLVNWLILRLFNNVVSTAVYLYCWWCCSEVLAPCRLVGRCQLSGQTYYLHLQGWRWRHYPHRHENLRFIYLYCTVSCEDDHDCLVRNHVQSYCYKRPIRGQNAHVILTVKFIYYLSHIKVLVTDIYARDFSTQCQQVRNSSVYRIQQNMFPTFYVKTKEDPSFET